MIPDKKIHSLFTSHAAPPKKRMSTGAKVAIGFWGIAGVELAFVGQGIYQTHLANQPSPPHHERLLTEGEATLLRGVFGENFETANIRLRMHETESDASCAPEQLLDGTTTACATAASVKQGEQDNIDFWRPQNWSEDYSRSRELIGIFMHEAGHLFQNRGNDAESCRLYEYTLTDSSKFSDFCVEQQSAILQDYVTVFIAPKMIYATSPQSYRMQNYLDSDRSNDVNAEPNLKRIVEERFPSAQNLRLDLEHRLGEATLCAANLPSRSRYIDPTPPAHAAHNAEVDRLEREGWENCFRQAPPRTPRT